ncbi:MAG TPA: error-prone DNA polymerase [Stellaceae bacterium]|nr:error-prone DNA polymerase [Stellaceae bacterium]
MPELPPKQSKAFAEFGRLSRTIGDGSLRFLAQKRARTTGGGGFSPTGGYAELQVASNFTFLRGGSHPDELVRQAALLGLDAIAITDRNSLAGIVRAHQAAKDVGIRLVVGVRLDLRDGASLLAYPEDRAAYGRLTTLLTLGKRRAPKGECHLDYADVAAYGEGLVIALLPPDNADRASLAAHRALATRVAADFPDRAYLAAHHLYRGDDLRRLARLAAIARDTGIKLLATGDVLYHAPERRPLQDVLTCICEHCTIREAGFRLAANAERHLKPAHEMARLFRGHEEALTSSLEIARHCRFSLDELRYEYPEEPVPEGITPQSRLAQLAWGGASEKFPGGVSDKIRERIEHELALIEELDFARYFLTVHDIVRFARSRAILCQGRGSAANSVVCYCLGITSVDPDKIDVLFERFISAARGEPPDIDVDFEHERREEVIQYIYEKYGRDRAGLAATLITYRSRSAIREVGKAMGLSGDVVAALGGMVWGWSSEGIADERVREAGLDPRDRNLRMTLDLAALLIGFPRHLSQHVGGFVITRGPLHELVPIDNAAMEERTVIEWDKDDLDALGILKVDVLALGILTCIRKAFDLIERHHGKQYELATIPPEQKPVYDMLSKADSLGVFQVESRAQMSMLPRLKPREFYDLVIEVAIVRPGPIQGDMVHPYLRRRNGIEPIECPPGLRQVLEKTKGVPLFQEQAMQIAIVGAGFTPDEADKLRRAMATFKRNGDIEKFRDQFIGGMIANGYQANFATRCFSQIEGFGTYGFPESHAASFALLVYVSAWIKCVYPEVFACALLNSQPMGFYAPAQIVRDAREHGVEVLPVDVNHSRWDCTLEASEEQPDTDDFSLSAPGGGEGRGEVGKTSAHAHLTLPSHCDGPLPLPPEERGGDSPRLALRLGFRQIKGFSEDDANRLVERRGDGYRDASTLWQRSGLARLALERLAHADALRSMRLDRRQGLWALKALGEAPLPLFATPLAVVPGRLAEPNPEPMNTDRKYRGMVGAVSPGRPGSWVPGSPRVVGPAGRPGGPRNDNKNEAIAASLLPAMPLGEHVVEDYRSTSLSLKRHPLAFLRAELAEDGIVTAAALATLPIERRVAVAGLVLIRQRPGSAKGVIFITLEDETGIANLIIWPPILERFRRTVLGATLLYCRGRLQREEGVIHIVAEDLRDLTPRLQTLRARTGIDKSARKSVFALPERVSGYDPRDIDVPDIVIHSRDFR